jgi:ATP-binding cassette subfamily B protein
MDAGHIVEQGSHAQLLARGGFYHSLYHSQFTEADGVAG